MSNFQSLLIQHYVGTRRSLLSSSVRKQKKWIVCSVVLITIIFSIRSSTKRIWNYYSNNYNNNNSRYSTLTRLQSPQQQQQQQQHDNKKSTTRYIMKHYTKYNMKYVQGNRCNIGINYNKWGRHPIWRDPLSEQLQVLLNFTTYIIQTAHNIIIMGDSVTIHFGQLLEEAIFMGNNNNNNNKKKNNNNNNFMTSTSTSILRTVIHESWAGNEGVTISTRTKQTEKQEEEFDGNTIIANYRLNGMFLEQNEGKPLPNACCGGWNKSHVETLLHHSYWNHTIINHKRHNNSNNKRNKFDTMIFRIPHGWLQFHEINETTIRETIHLAHNIFGIRNIIIIDIPFTNNIKTIQDLDDRKRTNELLQEIASSYNNNNNNNNINDNQEQQQDRIKHVAILKFARFTDHLMEYNARLIGMIPSHQQHTVITNKSYTLNRLGCRPKFPLSIAQGCSIFVQHGKCQCRRNRITQDGLHWCLESIGGRFVAAIACLLSCFDKHDNSADNNDGMSYSSNCETQCNNRFMSLRPLDFVDGEVFG